MAISYLLRSILFFLLFNMTSRLRPAMPEYSQEKSQPVEQVVNTNIAETST